MFETLYSIVYTLQSALGTAFINAPICSYCINAQFTIRNISYWCVHLFKSAMFLRISVYVYLVGCCKEKQYTVYLIVKQKKCTAVFTWGLWLQGNIDIIHTDTVGT